MSITHPSFGTLDDNRIIIFDTTLRDGEQSPGFSMNLGEKIRMAETLTELGVDVLEAGFAIASPGDFESVKTISETIGQRDNTPVIASLARAGQMDVMSAADALRPARRKRIHIVIATSDLHMKYKLRLTPEEVIQATVDSVTLARQHADDVEWSAEDATRSDPDFLDQGRRHHDQPARHRRLCAARGHGAHVLQHPQPGAGDRAGYPFDAQP
jgi:2-isopropylmalate synthase